MPVPYTFSAVTKAKSSEVNANFDWVENILNPNGETEIQDNGNVYMYDGAVIPSYKGNIIKVIVPSGLDFIGNLEDAINDVTSSSGFSVVLMPGTHYINNQLSIVRDMVTIKGFGRSTIIAPNTGYSDTNTIIMSGADSFQLLDLTIEVPASAGSYGFYFGSVANLYTRLKNVTFTGGTSTSIAVRHTNSSPSEYFDLDYIVEDNMIPYHFTRGGRGKIKCIAVGNTTGGTVDGSADYLYVESVTNIAGTHSAGVIINNEIVY